MHDNCEFSFNNQSRTATAAPQKEWRHEGQGSRIMCIIMLVVLKNIYISSLFSNIFVDFSIFSGDFQ